MINVSNSVFVDNPLTIILYPIEQTDQLINIKGEIKGNNFNHYILSFAEYKPLSQLSQNDWTSIYNSNSIPENNVLLENFNPFNTNLKEFLIRLQAFNSNGKEFVDYSYVKLWDVCETPGDEDSDGLSDCQDIEDCPFKAYCDESNQNQCNLLEQCKLPPLVMLWNKKYDGGGMDIGTGATIDNEKNIYIAGTKGISNFLTEDVSLFKINQDGVLNWNQSLGGPYYDYGYDIAISPDGGIFVVGGKTLFENDVYNIDIWLLKFDKNGNLIWDKTIGNQQSIDLGKFINTDKFGNIYIAAVTDSGAEHYVYNSLLIKLDKNGNQLWEKTFGNNLKYDMTNGLAISANGDLFLVGETKLDNFDENDVSSNYSYWVLKYDASGNLIWNKTFKETIMHNEENDLALAQDGSIFIAGWTPPLVVAPEKDVWLVKLKSESDLEWEKTVGFEKGYESSKSITVDSTGNLYMAGNIENGSNNSQVFLLKFDSEGNLSWHETINDSYYAAASDIIIAPDGTLYIAGTSAQSYFNLLSADKLLIKYHITEFCGNSIIEQTEQCDDGNLANGDGCDSTCKIEPLCGNNIIETGEVCDGTSLASRCTSFGYETGSLACCPTCSGFDKSNCSYDLMTCSDFDSTSTNPYLTASKVAGQTQTTYGASCSGMTRLTLPIAYTYNDSCSGNILTEWTCAPESVPKIIDCRTTNCSQYKKPVATTKDCTQYNTGRTRYSCSAGKCVPVICGDRVCNGGETCKYCAKDCGACSI